MDVFLILDKVLKIHKINVYCIASEGGVEKCDAT